MQNIRVRGEFVVNVVNEAIVEAMNVCAIDFPHGVSELAEAGADHRAGSARRRAAHRRSARPAWNAVRSRPWRSAGHGSSSVRWCTPTCARSLIDPAGPYIRAEQLHAVGRMNGMGSYVRTRDAFFHLPRIKLADWEKKKAEGAATSPPA